MLATVLPLLIALNAQVPCPHDLQTTKSVGVLKWASEHRTEVLARPRKGPGPDHGADPDDERHDYGLPSNQHAGDGYPSDDPYNNSTPNNRNSPNKPY
jgi:hypothetical protein